MLPLQSVFVFCAEAYNMLQIDSQFCVLNGPERAGFKFKLSRIN